MQVTVKSGDAARASKELLAVPMPQLAEDAQRVPRRLQALDRAFDGAIAAVVKGGDFRGRAGEIVTLYSGAKGAPQRLMLIGLGDEGEVDGDTIRKAAGSAVRRAAARKVRRPAIVVPTLKGKKAPEVVQALAEGALLGGYRFDNYLPRDKDAPTPVLGVSLVVETANKALRDAASRGATLAASQNVARDLSNEPPNELPPVALARAARRVSREVGLRCKVMEPAELKRRKMGALLAVGGGSVHTPRLVVMEHKPRGRGAAKAPTICLVGKGITFDSGGISIKPSAAMDEMKHDMSGAATVVGAMRAIGELNVPLHVVGIIAAAENMPSGTAYRPGDIVRSASGKTIEILNTDAEGRVVLADALHLAVTEYAPSAIIDLATLTGACMVALGGSATGLFGNDEGLIGAIRDAGDRVGERQWPMPLLPEHRKAMRSQVADLKNAAGRDAGASTAAGFLAAFVGDTPWVHLDIAGTGWTSTTSSIQSRGATGVGVRMLLDLLDHWTKKPPVPPRK